MSRRHLTALVTALLFAVAVAAARADDTTTTDTTTTTTTTVTTGTTTDPPPETTTATTTPSVRTPPPKTTQASPTSKPPPPPPAPKASARTTTSSHPESAREPHARPHHEHRRHRRDSKPLRVTPPLGQTGYVFPVAGAAAYGDTYGAFRGDVHGKWHHGTDIFAALGAPVVAVASGTVNRVGWRRAGGWRVWVRDGAANEFYYAHLSGYARPIFHSRYVRAGQVIGFVGNTGDAFPGPPHLHFEIHPHQLLRLHYDGAVNPSSYLEGWSRLQRVEAPRPKHPALTMKAEKRRQAEVVFRRLLVARDRVAATRRTEERTPVEAHEQRARRVAEVKAPAARAASTGGSSPPLVAPLLMGVVSVAVFAALVLLVRLGRRVRAPRGSI